ncbi:MAG: SCO family protein [Chloroflexi bacterium]|nr:SCO family protein [Chloroflexota bacterium]
MRLSKWIIIAGLVLLVAVGGAAAWLTLKNAHTFSGVAASPPAVAANFTLTNGDGQIFSLDDLRGQWILLSYGYTSCPDVCPATLANLRQVKEALSPAQAEQVRVVFVTLDPERDSADILKRYVAHFGADFIGLTGSPDEVAAAAQAYGVKYEKKISVSAAGYLVSHSAYVYLIDPQFRLRLTFPFGVRSQEIVSDLNYLISRSSQKDE